VRLPCRFNAAGRSPQPVNSALQGFQCVAQRGKFSTGWFYGFKPQRSSTIKANFHEFKLTFGNVD